MKKTRSQNSCITAGIPELLTSAANAIDAKEEQKIGRGTFAEGQ
jgi:hypothetical protein